MIKVLSYMIHIQVKLIVKMHKHIQIYAYGHLRRRNGYQARLVPGFMEVPVV